MSLRPMPNRALIRPIEPEKTTIIEDLSPDPPVLGTVLALGRTRCTECGQPTPVELEIGAIVLMRPTYYQEVTVDGDVLWMVDVQHILARVES